MSSKNRYQLLIEEIFFSHFSKGKADFQFKREEIEKHAARLGIKLPKNLGDLVYSFRYRAPLPKRIRASAPKGKQWVILPAGRSRYRFQAIDALPQIFPNKMLAETKVPDATPGVISMYALGDEQALLAKLRYNRLIDIFTRATTYSLQSHLRTFVPGVGQIETDEVYVGVDRGGVHYAFPVQAKGGKDKLSPGQIQQDIGMCHLKFPALICRPIGAQFMAGDVIALFEFQQEEKGIEIVLEKHYRLVAPDELSPEELAKYRKSNRENDCRRLRVQAPSLVRHSQRYPRRVASKALFDLPRTNLLFCGFRLKARKLTEACRTFKSPCLMDLSRSSLRALP